MRPCLMKVKMRIRKPLIIFLALVIFVGLWMHLSFAEMTPKEILHKADMARGNLDGVQWKVHIHSLEEGREQDRKLDVKARGYDFLSILTEPPKVKRNKLLMVNHNMWFTKPGLKKPVPVSSRQKLIGGAAYGDIAATNYADDYEIESVVNEQLNGEKCDVFDLKASTKKATYDRIKYWISKSRTAGLKAQYYTVSGKMFKWAEFEYQNRILLEDKYRPFISKIVFYDALISGNITTMCFSEPEIVKLPPSTLDLNLFMMR